MLFVFALSLLSYSQEPDIAYYAEKMHEWIDHDKFGSKDSGSICDRRMCYPQQEWG